MVNNSNNSEVQQEKLKLNLDNLDNLKSLNSLDRLDNLANNDLNKLVIDEFKTGELFKVLTFIMEKLRSDNGCIWDKEQTHQSIKRNLIEEAYEAVESIEENNYENLKEEMGDLLLQVVFHSQIAKEEQKFNIDDVLKTIIKKLIRRHPHVFGNLEVNSSKEILSNWEEIKKEERKQKKDNSNNSNNKSIFSNIPKTLPSLHLAHEIQSRAARFDFDWENAQEVFDKVNEEVLELNKVFKEFKDNTFENNSLQNKLKDEIGDLLFSIVNLCRHLKIDAEQCLKDNCKKFISRFDYMQQYSEKNNIDFKKLPLKEKDKIWKIAKKIVDYE